MFHQSADQMIPFLNLLQQPAFCLDAAGTVNANAAARGLVPANAADLDRWLGNSRELYDIWDRQAPLELPVSIRGSSYIARFVPLSDGTAVLLTAMQLDRADVQVLSVAAQVLSQPLTSLYGLVQQLADEPELEAFSDSTGAILRHVHRITRLSRNLADFPLLQEGKNLQTQVLLDVRQFLTPLLEEICDLCRDMGRDFDYRLPDKPLAIMGTQHLLERAILNLISNALKYGDPAAPITFRLKTTNTHLLVQIGNRCSEDGSVLLRAAFTRTEDRGMLPDPRWGVGLGLPIVHQIARIHGGMAAVEVSEEQIATVTLSLSRRRSTPDAVLTAGHPPIDFSGGLRSTLVELSDALPNKTYIGI